MRFAKQSGTAVLLVGHVTKEGALAGPRVLEHMVDTVLYFEGEHGSRFRVIRAIKNRFGAANELGVFAMTDRGLARGRQPLGDLPVPARAGGCRQRVMVTREGTRPLLVEVQALVDQSPLAEPAAGGRWASTRTGSRCCSPCCTATAASRSTTRTSSSTWSAACA